MKYIFYILYRYYSSGRWEHNPLSKTAFILGTMMFLNLATLAVALYAERYTSKNVDINTIQIIGILIYIAIVAMLCIFIRQKDMARVEFSKRYKSMHGWFMLLYILFSFFLFGGVVMSELIPNFKKNDHPRDIITFEEVPEIKK